MNLFKCREFVVRLMKEKIKQKKADWMIFWADFTKGGL
jgi:hypothetical protein